MDHRNTGTAPHIRTSRTTAMVMLNVIVALLPALIWAIYSFGLRALTVTALCVVCCVLFEFLYEKAVGRKCTVYDCSAVLTGILLAFTLPVSAPLYLCIIGAFFAIVVVKQLFGGLGKNFLNPALSAHVFLLLSFPEEMKVSVAPLTYLDPISMTVDTPGHTALLVQIKNGTLPDDISYLDLFLGKQGGYIGEISVFLLLLGGLYLIARRIISPILPLSFLATVGLLTFFFPHIESAVAWEFMAAELFSGGVFLAAFFMCTDYTTSPITAKGRLIYGIGCGLLTVFIRYYGGYPDGVFFAVLIMNLLVWYLDRYAKPVKFGGNASEKK